jgi:hypothetical protein
LVPPAFVRQASLIFSLVEAAHTAHLQSAQRSYNRHSPIFTSVTQFTHLSVITHYYQPLSCQLYLGTLHLLRRITCCPPAALSYPKFASRQHASRVTHIAAVTQLQHTGCTCTCRAELHATRQLHAPVYSTHIGHVCYLSGGITGPSPVSIHPVTHMHMPLPHTRD